MCNCSGCEGHGNCTKDTHRRGFLLSRLIMLMPTKEVLEDLRLCLQYDQGEEGKYGPSPHHLGGNGDDGGRAAQVDVERASSPVYSTLVRLARLRRVGKGEKGQETNTCSIPSTTTASRPFIHHVDAVPDSLSSLSIIIIHTESRSWCKYLRPFQFTLDTIRHLQSAKSIAALFRLPAVPVCNPSPLLLPKHLGLS